tara:strand:- start:486 stop:842 length:357 start_codon:yes stop_codon:yes gene_type:complete
MNHLPQEDQPSNDHSSNEAFSEDLQRAIARIKGMANDRDTYIRYCLRRNGVALKKLNDAVIGEKYGSWILTSSLEIEGGVFKLVLRCSSCGHKRYGLHRFIDPRLLGRCPKCKQGARD